ncbi:MAG TPA: ATP-binding protein, partial [Candidatus Eisenbacteria bacterium]
IAVLVFVTLLAVFLAWLGGEALILRPVRSLAAAADRLRGGDLRARTGLEHGSGEIGRLGLAFDEMAEALETRDRERREAEERMREEREFSTRLIESSMDGIVAIDHQYRITVWNAAMERITGLSRDQVLGRSPLELFTFFEEIGGESRLQDVLAGNTVVAKDRPFFIPETDRKGHADSHYSPLRDEAGAIVGALAIIHETTQRKKLEEQFRQAQKMESVGRLAGGVAHDFNNLLTAILGYADLLRMRLGPDHPAQHDAEEIRRAGERAEQLTRQLLAFSRHQTFAAKVVDLNHLIAETERMLRRMIGEDVQLSTSLSAGHTTVRADPGQIHQVIMNLVVNARDAMPDGGMVTIETQDVVLGEDFVRDRVDLRPGEYVLMAITDTGHGMDAETLSRIFEPFFTTKDVGRGTGLGLSTVYGIVKQSGGHVDVYSEVGIGTTFKIYLPRVAESPTVEAASPGGAVRTRAGTERVLLVEDEDLVRSVIREALSRAGYQVTEAANARDAIDIASRDGRPFDLLITDVVMPQTTGPDLAARLVDRDPNLDVLFMSGYMERAIVLHGVLKSSATFIAKPFSPEDLLKKVREVLDRRTGAPT